jgi:hypothetical protein
LHDEIVYRYRVNAEQIRKTPSPSFLRGFAMGNYYLGQFIQNSGIPFQYFLAHLPSVQAHCKSIVTYLDPGLALKYLRFISLLFSRLNLDFVSGAEVQPWKRNIEINARYFEFLKVVQKSDEKELYAALAG